MSKWRKNYRAAAVLLATLCPVVLNAGSINDIDDLFIGVWSPYGGEWAKSVPVCVSGDASDTTYRVQASSLNNPTSFTLNNNIGDKVRYEVFWYSGEGLANRELLQPGRESSRAYNYSLEGACSSGPNAKLLVNIVNRDIQRAVPAIYDDTLLITLSPL